MDPGLPRLHWRWGGLLAGQPLLPGVGFPEEPEQDEPEQARGNAGEYPWAALVYDPEYRFQVLAKKICCNTPASDPQDHACRIIQCKFSPTYHCRTGCERTVLP